MVVDGVNITARIGAGQAPALLAELGHAVASLSSGRRDRVALQLEANQESWELGLEADGADALVTVYRCGPRPEVAIHERRVALGALHEGVLEGIKELTAAGRAPNLSASLRAAQRALASSCPVVERPRQVRAEARVAPRSVKGLAFAATGEFRQHPAEDSHALLDYDQQIERSDLHGLLVRADCEVIVRGRTEKLGPLYPFLLAERLLALGEDALTAWQLSRPIFRRIELGEARIGVRRGPGDGPVTLTVSSPDLRGGESVTFPNLEALALARAAVRFATALVDTFVRLDPTQSKNLRLGTLQASARALGGRIQGAISDDSVTNPEPDSYRCYGPGPVKSDASGKWSQGGKMRFVPRWVATVPGIDLRATYLCGDRLIVGAARETACIHRTTGALAWRLGTQPAVSVVTPCGLARIHPEGRVVLHDLDSGDVRFTTAVAPRVGGGATGAVVTGPGLPKLLILAECDRQITALDLVSGEVRWRYTARQPGAYRVRRAGKLLLVAGGDSALVALCAATGEVVWRQRARLPFWGQLAIDRDAVFALSGTPNAPGKLHHLDPWTGELRWTSDLEERHAPGQPPLVTPDCVVVPTRDRRGVGARGYDRATGQELWGHAPGLGSPTTAWLAVDDSIVANTAAGALLCLEARTGRLRYNHVFSRHVEADQPRRLEPVLRNGALFVPQHQVHVVRPRDGEIIGTVPSDLIPDLLRVDERCDIYVAEESGHLAGFGVAPRLMLVT
jgi:hypothetical protein